MSKWHGFTHRTATPSVDFVRRSAIYSLSEKDVCTVSKSKDYSVVKAKSQAFTRIGKCLFLGLLKSSSKSKKITPKTLDIFLNLWYVVSTQE